MFVPVSSSRAPELDSDMREHLARSLDRIGDMAATVLAGAPDMAPALAHVRAHRQDPGLFARYYDLVFSLQAANRPAARRLWGEIASLASEDGAWRLVPFGPEALGEDAERFARLVASPGEAPFFGPPEVACWPAFERGVGEALDLLEEVCPAWRRELQGLVCRVIGVGPSDRPGARRFAGASSFMIWGAIFLNVRLVDDRLAVLSTLIHEATHQLLFAVSRDRPLVENPPQARYPSPLRQDPRPMDGVFHATYVAARVSYFYELLLAAGSGLAAAEAASVREQLERHRRGFVSGYEVVQGHARLTPLGRSVIEEAATHLMATA